MGDLVCAICHQDDLRDPRYLPCHHYYCKECIAELVRRTSDSFLCPECRASTRVSDLGDLEKLPRVDTLQKVKAFVQKATMHASSLCQVHEVPLKLFCYQCDQLICAECILSSHSDHAYQYIQEAASCFRQPMKEGGYALSSMRSELLAAIDRIGETRTRIMENSERDSVAIKDYFSEMVISLRNKEEELLTRLTYLVDCKLTILTDQERSLKEAASAVEKLSLTLNEAATNMADEEVVVSYRALLDALKEKEDVHTCTPLEPHDTADIQVYLNCHDALREMLRNEAKVVIPPVYVPRAEVGRALCVSVRSWLPPDPHDHALKVSLMSSDGTVFEPLSCVKKTLSGLYEATFCLQKRGQHQLSVAMGDESVHRQMFVTISTTQVGKPLRLITNVQSPVAVAFNSEGQLFVTEVDGNKISVFNRNTGSLLRSFPVRSMPFGLAVWRNLLFFGLCKPQSISVLTLGPTSHHVLKTTAGCVSNALQEFDFIRGMKVTNDDLLYVCDSLNNCIKIFDLGLNFMKLETPVLSDGSVMSILSDIAFSEDGLFFVSGASPPVVGVFNAHWKCVRVIQDEGLTNPAGICIDNRNQLLYVVDSEQCSVFVFRLDGGFVKRFCKKGKHSGELQSPFGIEIDNDGYIYVCDRGNKRIQVF